MRFAIMGSVDSGKTELFKRLTNLDPKENYGRTEQIRCHKILDGRLQVVDTPGHTILDAHKELALRMADVVLYVVDSNKPSYTLLQKISSMKPTIVLINKWDLLEPKDVEIPLKKLVSVKKEELYLSLDRYRDDLLKINLDFKPFLQATPEDLSQSILPLSASKAWGLDLLISWLRGLSRRFPSSNSYFYKVKDGYELVGLLEKGDFLALSSEIKDSCEKIFKYNPTLKIYQFKPGYDSKSRLLEVNKDYFDERKSEFNASMENELIKQIELTLKNPLMPDYELYYKCSDYTTQESLKRIASKFFKNIFKIPSIQNIQKTSQNSWIFLELTKLKAKNNILNEASNLHLIDDSFVGIIGKLHQSLREILKIKIKEKEESYKFNGIFQLEDQYFFFQGKDHFIMGGSLVNGVIFSDPKSKELVQILDQNLKKIGSGYIDSIEVEVVKQKWKNATNNNSEIERQISWAQTGKLASVKIKSETPLKRKKGENYYLIYQSFKKNFKDYCKDHNVDTFIERFYKEN